MSFSDPDQPQPRDPRAQPPAWRPAEPAPPPAAEQPPPADAGQDLPAGPVDPGVGREPRTVDVRPAPVRGEPGGPRRSWWRSTAEWVLVVALALGAAFLVKTFVLQTFYIPSASMEPTLQIGDRVFVNKLAYSFHPIHRGDIVVFTLPPGESAGPGIDDLIKRVVGLPGDTIEAIGGRVYINGKPLDEPYLPRGTITTLLPRQKIKAGEYFLMGDNRTDSKDSRFFGTISDSRVVGRAFIRVWPLGRIGFL